MRVLLFQAGFVVVLVAFVVHEIQLIHHAAGFQHFQRAVDGNAVEFRIFCLGQLIQTLGIQMLAGLIDQLEQNLALAGKAHAFFTQGTFDGVDRHGRQFPF